MAVTPSEIRLPDALKPADGRFGSGPSKVRQSSVEALAAVAPGYLGTSHRRDTVRKVVGEIRGGLRDLYALPAGYDVLLGNGGATLFWDAATFCLIDRRSQHVTCGEFSSKFAKAAALAPHLESPEVVEAPYGAYARPRPSTDVDALALIHNETSTGVSAPIERPAGFTDDCLVLVDGTSAAGGMPVDTAAFDAYYFSPQKCFGADGGIWLALCSPAALDRIRGIKSAGRPVPAMLDLSIALENSEKNQTYNTPALATLFLMADTIRWIAGNGGLAWAAGRCAASAAVLYGWADASDVATPYVADPAARSTTVATIDFTESVDAAAVARTLRANGVVDVEPYRKLGRNQLRISMFPAVETEDVETLIKAIDHVVGALSG